jgi:tRNA(His) guanylyltransferase
MSKGDSLGDRMKRNYEAVYTNIKLPRRLPVILRIDGKAFHTLIKSCQKPFDDTLINVMNRTAIYLCENIQGAQIAYVQSDEISVLLHNYKKLNSDAWFDNTLQKMVSISAAMASSIFTTLTPALFDGTVKPVQFDSRAFVLPESEVNNYFLWRQQDATRNSVQMLARSLYSHKECSNKNGSELQEMCFQKGHNWNDLPTTYKRGRCIVKNVSVTFDAQTNTNIVRNSWVVDNETPIFSQNNYYINGLLAVEDQ